MQNATTNKPATTKRNRKPADKPANLPAVIENTTAEAVTEAKPDPRVERAERIAADRNATRAFYRALNGAVSIPVKPLSAFKLAHVTAHPIARNPSARQAAAIAAAFAAANVKLADGASAPRVFEIDGIRSAIENGALRDAISSGLITVTGDSPETSKLRIAAKAAARIVGLIGEKPLKAAGILA